LDVQALFCDTESDLLGLMAVRPPEVELVLTGRKAPQSVVAGADLVTEMKEIKHYFQKGILAREGIEK
jgi:cob(I)alamin adenosyltransferase